MIKKDLNYVTGIFLVFVFLWMLLTGLIQLRFELHRFIYHLYGVYLLIVLTAIHLFVNGRKLIGFIKNRLFFKKKGAQTLHKGDIKIMVSIALIVSFISTLVFGYLQIKLNFPRSRFVYHIYSAYCTLTLALVHLCINFKKVNDYLKSKSPSFLLNVDKKLWRGYFKNLTALGGGFLVVALLFVIIRQPSLKKQQVVVLKSMELIPKEFTMSTHYHETTKHTPAELLRRTGGLDWSKQPEVFKEYPQAELIQLASDFDFDSIQVEEAIDMDPSGGSFSSEPITKRELSLLLYHTNGITAVKRYPGLTYYFRAAPSAGALYPTVIYLLVNNVEGLKKGIYHYSVKDHALRFLKKGDYLATLALWVQNPSRLKKADVVFMMSTIFYRTKWKYLERGYRYVLLDTGHVGGNLTLTARSLGLDAYSISAFVDDKINQMLNIDGLKEAVVSMHAVGRRGALEGGEALQRIPQLKKASTEKLPKDLTIAELLHESGKLDSFTERKQKDYKATQTSFKRYPEAKKIYLSHEFPTQGLSLDEAIRKRRSARDYSGKLISKLELSRLLYYTYGFIKTHPFGKGFPSMDGLFPLEIYVVVNNVGDISRGVYHYNVLEHALELIRKGDYRSRIARACLGQGLVGNANVAIIKTAVWERVHPYGDRGYRYIHLEAGATGENIYLEAISMGLGVCGIGAFFDNQINEIVGIDGAKESAIYVTSIGRQS